MSEKDPLLLAEGGALIEGAARRSGSSAAATQSSGLCCCKPTAVTYLHVSESADEAAGALIAELSIMPREWSDEGGRDARVVDALQRIWSAIASETPDTLRMAPPRIPSREWRKIGFQGDDPYTDMRGAGLSGFTYIARLAEEYAEARMIGAAPDSELPFGIGALNVLWMLRCHLMLFEEPPAFCPCCGAGIRGEYAGRQPHRGRHIRGFAMLMLDDRDAWMHLFALSFLVTAALWRKRGEVIALAAAAAAAAARRATGSGSGSTAPASVRSSLTGTMMAAGAGGSAGGGGKASMAESAASGASGATSASAAQAQARHKRISAAKIAPLSNSSASPSPSGGGAGMMALPGSISRDAAGSGSSHGILPVPGAGASGHGASNGSLPTASADGHGAALLHGHNSTPGGGSGSGASRTGSVSVLTASVGPGGASTLGGVGAGVTSVSIAGAASAATTTGAGSAATTIGGSLGSGAVVAVGDARLLEFNSILREAREVVLEALATFPPDLTTLRLALFKRLRAKGLGGGAGGGAAVSGGGAVAAGPAAAAAVAAAHAAAAHAAHAPSAASLSMSLSVPMLISHPSAVGPLAFEPLPAQLTGAGKGDAPTTDDGAFGAGFAGDSSRSGGGASAAMPVAVPVPVAGGGTGPRRSSRHVSGHAAGQANSGLLSSEALQASLRTTSGSSGGALTAAAAAGTSYAASTPPFGASPAAGFGSYMAGPGEAGHVHAHAHSHGHPHSHGHGHAAHAINAGGPIVPGGASSSSLQFGGSVAALWGSQMISPDAAAAGAALGGTAAAPPAGSGHR